jgi:hypothetical protein
MAAIDLEPIDLYGNWKVTQLTFGRPKRAFGLRKGRSKFKIRNKGLRHVLVKKRGVGWNGRDSVIPLQEVTNSGPHAALFSANVRLRAIVTFRRGKYEVSFGSRDNGESLRILVVPVAGGPIRGGSGTAGRGG